MESDLGYTFHPAPDPDFPGYIRLDIVLSRTPTQAHFDPEHARFDVANPEHGIEIAHITHPWPGPESLRVVAGYIRLIDRRESVVEAFSFGGLLEISSTRDHTHCSLASSAPIFHITDRQDLPALLVNEFEALLAIRRAGWAGSEVDFNRKLASLDPLLLYAVSLEEAEARLLQSPVTQRGDVYWQMRHTLNGGRSQLKEADNWPDPLPVLADLL